MARAALVAATIVAAIAPVPAHTNWRREDFDDVFIARSSLCAASMRKSADLAMPTIVRREDGAQRSTLCEISHAMLSPSNATVYALWINNPYELRSSARRNLYVSLNANAAPSNSSAQANEPITCCCGLVRVAAAAAKTSENWILRFGDRRFQARVTERHDASAVPVPMLGS